MKALVLLAGLLVLAIAISGCTAVQTETETGGALTQPPGSSIKNCGDDDECFLDAFASCSLAKFQDSKITVTIEGYVNEDCKVRVSSMTSEKEVVCYATPTVERNFQMFLINIQALGSCPEVYN